MSTTETLLVELGTEELPPKALARLSNAFADGVAAGLERAGITGGATTPFASPRRLAVRIENVAPEVPARQAERRGPSLKAAFDSDGNPTRAATGFARSCGVETDALERLETDQGAWLVHRSMAPAVPLDQVLPDILAEALARLPIPKRMRWGSSDAEFVRPVRWLLILHGDRVVPCELMGVSADRLTRGHRFHCPTPIEIANPDGWLDALRSPGHVLADLRERRALIRTQVEARAADIGGHVVIDEDLLDEVTALVEWPVAIDAGFESRFLEVPAEALIATMKSNQKYFHMVDEDGALMPRFIAVANIESSRPDSVREGNERVVRPRLADAEFFYTTDLRTPLADRMATLESIVFQRRLGSVADKSRRIAELAGRLCEALDADADSDAATARRAGLLCKCDLATEMVGEFPELQGTMGGRYARASGETDAVANAIGEVYLPRFAGDSLPKSRAGQAVSVADRLDTLTGIFAIGQPPTGDKDPFALRRAALGVLRILIEGGLDVNLEALTRHAADGHADVRDPSEVSAEVFDFMLDRLRAYYADRGVSGAVYAAVHARRPARPLDFDQRVHAVVAFSELPAAEALAAANKRIHNILRQAGDAVGPRVDISLLADGAESDLAEALTALTPGTEAQLSAGDYAGALTSLAGLREPVDAFFDSVRVMDDDEAVRANRLALLASISDLFSRTADISRLQES